MVMIGDEGQSDEGQAMESLGTGGDRGTAPFFASLLLCWRGGLAGETGAGALIIYFLLILLWIEMKL